MRKMWLLLLVVCFLGACAKSEEKVVIYTSVDQVFSEPILKDFERKTGIKVKAVYDAEAAKTVGLVNRLIAEKENPQADVFWNNECIRTIVLKKKGILAPYFSAQASDIPYQFKDKEGYWCGFSTRARILIYNTKLLSQNELPKSIFELTESKWKNKPVLAKPVFGSTASHVAALFVLLGDEKAEKFFRALKDNGINLVAGNSTSRDRVRDGEFSIGFTDTDDANVAIMDKKDVGMIFPDQMIGQIGTFVFPNTVMLIKGAPNEKNAKKLIDYLLSREIEEALAKSEAAQIPLRKGLNKPANMPLFEQIKAMDVDLEKVAEKIEYSNQVMQDIFLR